MARKRMALAAFEKGEGPWVLATGREGIVRVSPLKDGEVVGLEIAGAIGTMQFKSGLSTIKLENGIKYRFVKQVLDGVKPSRTCVEVVFDV